MLAAGYAALGKAIVCEDPPMLRQIPGADSIREAGEQLDFFLDRMAQCEITLPAHTIGGIV
jgi:hypothetical protein